MANRTVDQTGRDAPSVFLFLGGHPLTSALCIKGSYQTISGDIEWQTFRDFIAGNCQ